MQNQKIKKLLSALSAVVLLATYLYPLPAQAVTRSIIFPVIGSVHFSDDFGAPRSGHTHAGNDILGTKMLPLVAAADGIVRFVAYPEPSYGYMVSIEDGEGYQYWYLHINNDHPGTDDDKGGGRFAFAPGIESGNPVEKGQLIGWMGDSGNAESTSAHLHFELHLPTGEAVDPYSSLISATRISKPVVPPPLSNEILPFGEYHGGANIALGQVFPTTTEPELVAGAGPGGGPQIRLMDSSGKVISQFFAYDQAFRNGVDVAIGDVDGDGIGDIVTAPGPGTSPIVKVFDSTGQLKSQFVAYPGSFRGGVRVAVADVTGDGQAEIITGPTSSLDARIKIYDMHGGLLNEFFALDPTFRNGVDVAAIAATAGTPGEIVVGSGPGRIPEVKIFNLNGDLVNSFLAYGDTFTGGLHVAVGDAFTFNDDETETPEIITSPAGHGGGQVRAFSLDGSNIYSQFAYERWWLGSSYDVAATDNYLYVVTGPTPNGISGRRVSLRQLITPSTGDSWRFFHDSFQSNADYRIAGDPSRL